MSYEPVHSRENNSQKIDNHNKEEALIVDYANCEEVQKIETKEQKSGVNVISTLKKSMGEGSSEGSKGSSKSLDDLELTDDLFNLIDSMYEERKD